MKPWVSCEVLLPVACLDNNAPILQCCCLGNIDNCRLVHHSNQVREAVHLRSPVPLLQQAKTPVRAEHGVTYHHEGLRDLRVETGHHYPEQVLDHDGTVFGMQVHTQSMMCKIVVEHADDGIRALPHARCLINEVASLLVGEWPRSTLQIFHISEESESTMS